MNKQQLLDKENPTPKEAAIQQLLIRGSKTSLEADRRVFSKVNEALYKSNMKELQFQEVVECISQAALLAGGGELTPTLPANAAAKKPS